MFDIPPKKYPLWSSQAAIFTYTGGPTKMSPHVERWFAPGSHFAKVCQIVNVDFIEKSGIADCAIASNIVRAFEREHQI